MRKPLLLQKIVSGGQTGADRGALTAARELGVLFGGWAPRGFKAEDGVIPAELTCLMQETPSDAYDVRTRKNVAESDATLILHLGAPDEGTSLTARVTVGEKKPLWVEYFGKGVRAASWGGSAFTDNFGGSLTDFLAVHSVYTLNVAGSRESAAPGLQEKVRAFVVALLREVDARRVAFIRGHEGWLTQLKKFGDITSDADIERFVWAYRRDIDESRRIVAEREAEREAQRRSSA